MGIYIYRNNQQFGPYDESVVTDQLRSGQLSRDDMGIREGENDWKKLGEMFPDVTPAFAPIPPPPAAVVSAEAAAPVQYEAVYRGTTLQKVFFGFCLLIAVVALAATAFYFYSLMGSSGDLRVTSLRCHIAFSPGTRRAEFSSGHFSRFSHFCWRLSASLFAQTVRE